MNTQLQRVIRVPSCATTGLTKLVVCDTALARLRGVFFRPDFLPSHGIYLKGCASVHGFGLRRSLDVIFLDKANRVISVQHLHPYRACWQPGAAAALEIDFGRAAIMGIKTGDVLTFECLDRLLPIPEVKHQAVSINRQSGASMVEFLVVAPLLCYLGFGIVQLGFAYHAKNVLHYATFEAARTGAVNNADIESMRNELAYRIAPLIHGDGSDAAIASALQQASVAVLDPVRTHLRIINPTSAAFEDFGVIDADTGQQVIPNSHLRHRASSIGSQSGLSIQDANLLKIEVTHGYELRLPWFDVRLPGVQFVLRELMTRADPKNAIFYSRGQLPIQSVATVRMQSDAWATHVAAANAASTRPETDSLESNTPGSLGTESDLANEEPISTDGCNGPHGLPNGLAIDSITNQSDIVQCSVASAVDNVQAAPIDTTQENQLSPRPEC